VVSAGLYASSIDLWSPLIGALISSTPASINTTRKALDNIDTDIDIEDPLFVPKQAQTPPPSTQPGTKKR
jgi:hypothetical protein